MTAPGERPRAAAAGARSLLSGPAGVVVLATAWLACRGIALWRVDVDGALAALIGAAGALVGPGGGAALIPPFTGGPLALAAAAAARSLVGPAASADAVAVALAGGGLALDLAALALTLALAGSSSSSGRHRRRIAAGLVYVAATAALGDALLTGGAAVACAAALAVWCERRGWRGAADAAVAAGALWHPALLALAAPLLALRWAAQPARAPLHAARAIAVGAVGVGGWLALARAGEWPLAADADGLLGAARPGLLVAGALAVALWSGRRARRLRSGAGRSALLVRAAAATMLVVGALSGDPASVVVWSAPLAAAALSRRPPPAAWPLAVGAAALAAGHRQGLAGVLLDHPLTLAVAGAAAAAGVALAVVLLVARWRAAPPVAGASVAALVAFGAVGASWNTAPVSSNDVFLQMRVGADILAAGAAVPAVESYSATAAGREFVAHEWLASVAFAVLAGGGPVVGADGAPHGGAALSLLQLALMLAVAALLWRLARRAAPLLPPAASLAACTLALYLVSWRAAVRPHLFALLCVALVVLALERWRERQRAVELWWLLPLHALWSNLHGSAPLGAAVVAVVAGAAALEARLARRSVRPALALLALAAASGLACLANPRGPRLFGFASGMVGDGGDYIRARIFEWGRPWQHADGSEHWLALWLAFVVALWLGIALAWRRRALPLADVAVAAVATVMSVSAVRFVGDLAILCLPVLVRAWQPSLPAPGPAASTRALACVAVVVAACAGGLPEAPGIRRALGVGYGGNEGYAEVAWLRAHGASGVVYNEYEDGALIIHELPALKPVIDSRIDVYGPALVLEYHRTRADVGAFLAYLDERGVDVVMLRLAPERRPHREALADAPGWLSAARFDRREIFLRASGAREDGVGEAGP